MDRTEQALEALITRLDFADDFYASGLYDGTQHETECVEAVLDTAVKLGIPTPPSEVLDAFRAEAALHRVWIDSKLN